MVFELKTLANIRTTNRILSIVLILMLAGSNMLFSSHVSSHFANDSDFCSLCVHPGSTGTAITPEAATFFVLPDPLNLAQCYSQIHYLPVILHDHQSRAPPSLS
jgi:hypothetical protein